MVPLDHPFFDSETAHMQTADLKIRGMTCNGCVASVTRVLKALGGVTDVNVSLVGERASVRFDASLIDVSRLEQAVRSAGFETP